MKSALAYAPATFEERGTTVPFTTPMLLQARVRKDSRDKLEVVLSSMAASKGVYVVGWAALPDLATMTVHDRGLHELVLNAKASTPMALRPIILDLAKTGLAGPMAAQAAYETVAADEQYEMLTNVFLIVEVLGKQGIDVTELVTAANQAGANKAVARAALAKAAEHMKMPPDLLYDRVEAMSKSASPVGLPTSPQAGRLRHLVKALDTFCCSVLAWAGNDLSDAQPLGTFAGRVADHTLRIAENLLKRIDMQLSDISLILSEWDKREPVLVKDLGRLSWLVDGWEFILQMWIDAQGRSAEEQRETIAELFRFLPLVPTKESDLDPDEKSKDLDKAIQKWVRGHQNWLTGELDYNAVARVESLMSSKLSGEVRA